MKKVFLVLLFVILVIATGIAGFFGGYKYCEMVVLPAESVIVEEAISSTYNYVITEEEGLLRIDKCKPDGYLVEAMEYALDVNNNVTEIEVTIQCTNAVEAMSKLKEKKEESNKEYVCEDNLLKYNTTPTQGQTKDSVIKALYEKCESVENNEIVKHNSI